MEGSEYFDGLYSILEESKSSQKTIGAYSLYSSPERIRCLSLMGWPDSPRSLSQVTKKLMDESQHFRGAFIASLSFDFPRAAECLKPVKSQERLLYSIIKSLATDTPLKTISKLCLQLSFSASHPYSSAILLFLGNPSELAKLAEKLPFPDNLALACQFFADSYLKTFTKKLMENYRLKGDLNGIVLSGFTPSCTDIMETYLSASSDIQTIGLLSIYARTVLTASGTKLHDWVSLYKSKLNSLELYIFRARLEIDESRLLRSSRDNLRTSKCFYCSGVLTLQDNSAETWNEKDHGKKFISTCSNCPSVSLCCSVCCLPHGPAGNISGFDLDRAAQEDWFVWCENCNHGAHAEHLVMWFQDQTECPVVGCSCRCEETLKNLQENGKENTETRVQQIENHGALYMSTRG